VKNRKPLLQALFLALTGCLTKSAYADGTPHDGQTLYPAGSQQSFNGPDDYFSGDVDVRLVFPGNDTADYSGAYVTFQPGARTAWHRHPAGQHMIVTSGVALTGTRDGRVIRFGKGDAVWCPAGIDHWHGATPDAAMTHFVVTGSLDGENVVWKDKVSDAEYLGGVARGDQGDAPVGALSTRHQAIVPIAAYTANGDIESLKTAIHAGLDKGLSVSEVREVQIHLYAYAGFPRSLNGIAALMSVLDERAADGIRDEPGIAAQPLPSETNARDLGETVQTRLAGGPVGGPLFDFAPAMNELLQSHLFGDLFARGVLNYQDREIATLSALAALPGVDSQLQAHVRIATNVGLSDEQLSDLVVVLRRSVGAWPATRAQRALDASGGGRDDNP